MQAAENSEIRRALDADVPALATLGAETFVEAFGHLYPPEDLRDFLAAAHSPAAYARALGEPGVAVWVAVARGGELVAYAIAGPCKLPVPGLEPTAGEVRQLYVRAAFQQHRLGTRLLETALDWLAVAGRAPLYCGVWSLNHGAQRLYARYGFEKIGEYEFPVGRQRDREFILRQRLGPAGAPGSVS